MVNYMLNKRCNKCKEELPLSSFSKHSASNYLRPECKKCNNILSKQRKELKKIHGCPPENYKCPICERDEKEISSGGGQKSTRWVLDHDHETHRFRGWLCHNCNMGIGAFKDNHQILKRAIEYLTNELQ
jgi:Recombination endonuclease VII